MRNPYFWILVIFSTVGLFHDLIANSLPLVAVLEGETVFPAFAEWLGISHNYLADQPFEEALYPPIKYMANSTSTLKYMPPSLSSGHLLGTDALGRDVAAGIVQGTATALMVGLISSLISLVLGLTVGLASGFYGDTGSKMNIVELVILVLGISLGLFYLISEFYFGRAISGFLIFMSFIMLIVLARHLLKGLGWKKYAIPLDTFFTKMVELRRSIPLLMLLLGILPLFASPSYWNLILVMSLITWTFFARISRAETMSIAKKDYVMSAKSLGASDFKILTSHILPNILSPVLVIFTFNIAGTVLMESTLSFLGIGLPISEVSWGSILTQARGNTSAWWLAVFPGLAIFLVVFSLNNIFAERDDLGV